MWPFFIAVAALTIAHTAIYQITARTDYAICLSRLRVIGPGERDALIARHVERRAETLANRDAIRAACCRLTKDAGEFRLVHQQYVDSGAIWVVRSRIDPVPSGFPIAFLTNCGQVLTEQEYYDTIL